MHYARWFKNGHPGSVEQQTMKPIVSGGYLMIRVPESPMAQINGYTYQHREVMAACIGRSLRPEETVHHKNGDKKDNRLTNLELWASRHPKGQRVADLLEFARSIISIYDPDVGYPPDPTCRRTGQVKAQRGTCGYDPPMRP